MYLFCESNRLYLRPVTLKDSNFIYNIKSNELIKNFSIVNSFDDISNHTEIQDIKNTIKNNNEIYLILTLKEDNSNIGFIRSKFLNKKRNIVNLEFALNNGKRNGYMKEALNIFIEKLFSIGVERIEISILDNNKIAYSLLTSLNFKLEGTKRKAYYTSSKCHDVLILSLLKQE